MPSEDLRIGFPVSLSRAIKCFFHSGFKDYHIVSPNFLIPGANSQRLRIFINFYTYTNEIKERVQEETPFFPTYNLRANKDHISDNNWLSEVYQKLKQDSSRFSRKTETRLSGYFTGEAASWDSGGKNELGKEGWETKRILFLKPEQMSWRVQKQL